MITYHNAGNAGREYSRLELQDPSCGEYVPMVEFVVAGGTSCNQSVRLNTEQITHMHNVLSTFLSKHNIASAPMIEGDIL
jgi:tRNA A37 threonylcarbamoyltransferase TsaD